MEIFAGIVLFCLVEVYMQETSVQEREQHNELMRPEINPQTEIQPYCRNGKCAGISYREILNLYGGLFIIYSSILILNATLNPMLQSYASILKFALKNNNGCV